MRRARASPPPQYRDDSLLRFRDDRPLGGLAITSHPQLQFHKCEPPGRNRWFLPCSRLVLTTAQLALRRRKAGISRTFCSIELRTAEERPYGSRPCGAAWPAYSGRPSGWRAVGRGGGLSKCGSGALRSIRSAMRLLSLRSLPASSVSELCAG